MRPFCLPRTPHESVTHDAFAEIVELDAALMCSELSRGGALWLDPSSSCHIQSQFFTKRL
jgi:hypothetical protein